MSVGMNQVKLSEFGRKYHLRHIRVIRDFCLRFSQALAKNDLKTANFYQAWAQRIVKGINPFCRYLTEQDRTYLLSVKNRLENLFYRLKSISQDGEINEIKNLIEEIIVETLDLEKVVSGTSFSQLIQDVWLKNKQINNQIVKKLTKGG